MNEGGGKSHIVLPKKVLRSYRGVLTRVPIAASASLYTSAIQAGATMNATGGHIY
jgi:hypothetical protein